MSDEWNHTIMWLSVSDFFHEDISRFAHVGVIAVLDSFSWLDIIPLFVYIQFVYPINEHLGCFSFWLLWIVLQWTSVRMYLFQCLFSFLLCINLGVELLGYAVTPCSTSVEPLKCFPQQQFYTANCTVQGFYFLHNLTTLVVFLFYKKL